MNHIHHILNKLGKYNVEVDNTRNQNGNSGCLHVCAPYKPNNVYGNTATPMTLMYWLRPVDEDGDGKISPQDITDVCADARLPLKVSTHMLSLLGPDKKGHIGFKAFRKLFATDQLECFRSRVQNTLDFSDITGRESDLAAARAAINVDHVDLVEAAGSRAKNSWVDVKEKKTNARG